MTQLIPLPGCRLVRVARDGPTALTLVAEAKPDHARCPTCRAISTSVHSRYRRRPADLPASGKAIRLQLEVRRFYCCDPACPRRTFAEWFPKLLVRHAQRTRWLAGAQDVSPALRAALRQTRFLDRRRDPDLHRCVLARETLGDERPEFPSRLAQTNPGTTW